jgi:DNA-directed RNA polymerase subunit RPC12/RpoP
MVEFICKKCKRKQYSSIEYDDNCTYCDGKVIETGNSLGEKGENNGKN